MTVLFSEYPRDVPTTTERLLLLLSLLQTRRDWPGGVLAERLGIAPRTVRRDVDRLRTMGYRIDAAKGPDGGYRLEAGAELPPLLFDDEQVLALTAALRAPIAGLEEASARALATVRQVLPARLRPRADALRFTVAAAPAPAVPPERLVAVAAAVRASEVLRFAYAEAVRRVEPHHLVARQGRWYLIGFDLDRDDWRVFRVDRLEPRSPRGARFRRRALPVGSPAEFLEARFRGGAPGRGGRAAARWCWRRPPPRSCPTRATGGGGPRRRGLPTRPRRLVVGGARRVVRPVRRSDGRGRAARAGRRVPRARGAVRRGGSLTGPRRPSGAATSPSTGRSPCCRPPS